jgi:hypothetical protein
LYDLSTAELRFTITNARYTKIIQNTGKLLFFITFISYIIIPQSISITPPRKGSRGRGTPWPGHHFRGIGPPLKGHRCSPPPARPNQGEEVTKPTGQVKRKPARQITKPVGSPGRGAKIKIRLYNR